VQKKFRDKDLKSLGKVAMGDFVQINIKKTIWYGVKVSDSAYASDYVEFLDIETMIVTQLDPTFYATEYKPTQEERIVAIPFLV